MYPDCDWLISQKLQNNWFKIKTGETSNFIKRYSSSAVGGGGRNSAENANYTENCENSVNFEVSKNLSNFY